MPMQSAEPTKKSRIRQTKERNAGGNILRGFSVSAATIEIYSGPHMLESKLAYSSQNIESWPEVVLSTYEKLA